ncbi:hypothetical protein [Chengkuizengella sediminis]|uniref:hypothetical protein n=1 Tax=Chengkuizengella sediminis TaxID=1885917 RepID=UPI001389FE38|nr:hypothetical protein [Chengkuizengella sediminis]NDI35659.1 hypothetical protein [Chengkuizengella sediminis]
MNKDKLEDEQNGLDLYPAIIYVFYAQIAFAEIKSDLIRKGIEFDTFYNEAENLNFETSRLYNEQITIDDIKR